MYVIIRVACLISRDFVYLLNIKTVMMMMMTRRTTTATIAPAMILTCILSSSPT